MKFEIWETELIISQLSGQALEIFTRGVRFDEKLKIRKTLATSKKTKIVPSEKYLSEAERRREELIANQTEAEKVFKIKLKSLKIPYIFQKLVWVSSYQYYFLDFYIPDCNLFIEIDGGYHLDIAQQLKDKQRTANLEDRGYAFNRRFSNSAAMNIGTTALYNMIDTYRNMPIPKEIPKKKVKKQKKGYKLKNKTVRAARSWYDQ